MKTLAEKLETTQVRARVRTILESSLGSIQQRGLELLNSSGVDYLEYCGVCPRHKPGNYNGSMMSTIIEFKTSGIEVCRGEMFSKYVWRIPKRRSGELTCEQKEKLRELGFQNRGGVWGLESF